MLNYKAAGFDCNTCCLNYNDRLPDYHLYHFIYKIAGLRCGLPVLIAISYISIG
jgi:hypothetical protein